MSQVAIPMRFRDHRAMPDDITVMRAVRLWYAPIAEMQVEVQVDPGAKMGMAFSRTKEGFVFVSTVWPGRWAGNVLHRFLSSSCEQGSDLKRSRALS